MQFMPKPAKQHASDCARALLNVQRAAWQRAQGSCGDGALKHALGAAGVEIQSTEMRRTRRLNYVTQHTRSGAGWALAIAIGGFLATSLAAGVAAASAGFLGRESTGPGWDAVLTTGVLVIVAGAFYGVLARFDEWANQKMSKFYNFECLAAHAWQASEVAALPARLLALPEWSGYLSPLALGGVSASEIETVLVLAGDSDLSIAEVRFAAQHL